MVLQNQKHINRMTTPPEIINQRIFIMNSREKLILQVLKFKQLHQGSGNQDFVDQLLDQNPEQADEITRNVCARIPLALFNDLNNYCSLLEMNKREIITLALNDFFDKAQAVMDEFDAHPEA